MNDLARYHNDTVGALGADEDRNNFTQEAADTYDAVSDLAIDLLTESGVDFNSGDMLDVPVSEDVQTLLQLALFRCPQLRQLFEELLTAWRNKSTDNKDSLDDMGSVLYRGFTLVPSDIQIHIWDGPKFWNTAHGDPALSFPRAKQMIDNYLDKDK